MKNQKKKEIRNTKHSRCKRASDALKWKWQSYKWAQFLYIYIHIYSIWKRKREPEEPKLIWKWKGFHYNATEKFFNGNEHVIMSHSGWDHSIRYFCMRCFGECISNVKKWSKSVQICVCVCCSKQLKHMRNDEPEPGSIRTEVNALTGPTRPTAVVCLCSGLLN